MGATALDILAKSCQNILLYPAPDDRYPVDASPDPRTYSYTTIQSILLIDPQNIGKLTSTKIFYKQDLH